MKTDFRIDDIGSLQEFPHWGCEQHFISPGHSSSDLQLSLHLMHLQTLSGARHAPDFEETIS